MNGIGMSLEAGALLWFLRQRLLAADQTGGGHASTREQQKPTTQGLHAVELAHEPISWLRVSGGTNGIETLAARSCKDRGGRSQRRLAVPQAGWKSRLARMP